MTTAHRPCGGQSSRSSSQPCSRSRSSHSRSSANERISGRRFLAATHRGRQRDETADHAARKPHAHRPPLNTEEFRPPSSRTFSVLRTDNTSRVRDGYNSWSKRGHTRTSPAQTDHVICRRNVPADARKCAPIPIPNLHGKEGVDQETYSGSRSSST